MTQEQQPTGQLITDERGAAYLVPAAALAQYRVSEEQLAAWAAAQRVTDDEVQGYCQTGYTVRPGDSLWQIAQRAYGDGRLWVYLYAANTDQIGNPNLIHPGQTLRLL